MVDVGDIAPSSPSSSTSFNYNFDRVDSANEKDDSLQGPDHYKMDSKNRGFFLIFNHYSYQKNLDMQDRVGTDADVKSLKNSWELLGFQVKVYNNKSLKNIKKKIEKYCEKDHSDNDCFGCAVLTHGDENDILYAEDDKYNMSILTEPFCHCKSLLGKPKLFFIQACRGKKHDDGEKLRQKAFDQPDAAVDDSTSGNVQEIVIPTESDILIVYSTGPGYYSWRNQTGSWFIQMLTKHLDKFATQLELIQILTMVNRDVGKRKSETNIAKYKGKKQMPAIVSRLTALLFFSPPSATSKENVLKSVSFSGTNIANEAPMSSRQSTDVSLSESLRDVYYKKKLEEIAKKRELLELKEQIYGMKLELSQKVTFD